MTYTSEEILFAMFILKANSGFWSNIIERHWITDELFMFHVESVYSDLFSDRGIAEEEFEGIAHGTYQNALTAMSYDKQAVKIMNQSGLKKKIKFRFVDQE